MLSFTQQSVEIVRCDNGFVVEWKDERNRGKDPDDFFKDSRGVKIFKAKKDMDAFLVKFFGAAT